MADNNQTIFEIHLKALSPISITKRNFEILSETYTFIPAWTMWNVFVKLYAIKNCSINLNSYKTAQDKFKSIRLTNFYIAGENGEPLIDIQEDEKRKYVFAELKNAINTLTNTSLEGALYEREYIYTKNFIGWVRVNSSDLELQNFFKSLKDQIFFIGADKNTGFGKVKIEKVEDSPDMSKEPQKNLQNNKNNHYLLPVETNEIEFFPFVLREWDEEKGSGMRIVYQDL